MLKLNANTLATWCKEPTHWKKSWCWERLRAGGEGDDRGWDGWMASATQRTRVWADSRRQWRTGKPGVLQSMELQRVGHDWATEQKLEHSPSPRFIYQPGQLSRYSGRGEGCDSPQGTLSRIFTSWSFTGKIGQLLPRVKTPVFITVPLPVRGTIYISLLIPSLSPSRFNGQLWFRTHQKSF